MCVGDAVVDSCRETVTCPKSLESRFAKRPDHTSVIGCMICKRFLAYDSSTLLCFDCGKGICEECVNARRYHHRHPLLRCRILPRVGENRHATETWKCDLCGGCEYLISLEAVESFGRCYSNASTVYLFKGFTGFDCVRCRNYQVCSHCVSQSKLPKLHGVCSGMTSEWEFTVTGDL
jgi:hypothetical protein